MSAVASGEGVLASLRPPIDPAHRQDWLDRTATWFAGQDMSYGDTLIEQLCAAAVSAWRLEEAAMWQRIRFRSRFMRAASRPVEGQAGG